MRLIRLGKTKITITPITGKAEEKTGNGRNGKSYSLNLCGDKLDAVKYFFIKIGVLTFWKGCIKTVALNGSSYLLSRFLDPEKYLRSWDRKQKEVETEKERKRLTGLKPHSPNPDPEIPCQ